MVALPEGDEDIESFLCGRSRRWARHEERRCQGDERAEDEEEEEKRMGLDSRCDLLDNWIIRD